MKKIHEIKPQAVTLKRQRVAAYARVSHSYLLGALAQQVSYYNQYIQNHPEWEFIGVYVDEAISGKTIKARNEFKRLLTDCRKGKVDIILTKSISRFARKTVELLETVRELKNLGISIRFEKENIDTLTTDGEFLLTLLGSVAQEEVSNISENMRWAIKKKFEKGEPHVKQPVLGYRWGVDSYVIVPDEAMIVRQVFEWYLSGISIKDIYTRLNAAGKTTRKGNSFNRRIIHNILNQEMYTGRLILQKTYRPKFGIRTMPNHGIMPWYIVENAHEPIVTKEMFVAVQRLKNSKSLRKDQRHEENHYN